MVKGTVKILRKVGASLAQAEIDSRSDWKLVIKVELWEQQKTNDEDQLHFARCES
jgi:hypothetical protein